MKNTPLALKRGVNRGEINLSVLYIPPSGVRGLFWL
jgi:hypothetical protein